MLTKMLTEFEKPCKINMYSVSVLGSSPTTGTTFEELVIQTDCGFFFAFQRFQAFILHVSCLISKHEKQEKNAVNANKNANRRKVNDLGLIRAPPEKRKRITFYGRAFRFDTIHAEKELYFYAKERPQ